ncbi:unnamed protein product [Paramecium sonneborni]|uniref:WD40-repeat-containing domain n=1 Tax=Paramecium sonneborni TaxID=65129 RepID=A0A8S1RKB3_9CILI|nr:unnamed protein product [Paramecium sonneborni]
MIEQEFKCSHEHVHDNQKADIFLLEKSLPKDKRLICNQCWQFYDRNLNYISLTQAKILIHQNQEMLQNVIHNKILPILNALDKFNIYIIDIKTSFNNNIDTITSALNLWQQSLQTFNNSLSQYKLESHLNNLVDTQDLDTSVQFLNLIEQLKHTNISHYQKINDKLFTLFNSNVVADSQITLFETLKLTLIQQVRPDEQLLSVMLKQQEKSFRIKAICKLHENKPILFIHQKENLNLYCSSCKNREGKCLDEFITEWKTYDSQVLQEKQIITENIYQTFQEKFQIFQDLQKNYQQFIECKYKSLSNLLFDQITQQIASFKQMNRCFYECQIDKMNQLLKYNNNEQDQLLKEKINSIGQEVLNLNEDFINLWDLEKKNKEGYQHHQDDLINSQIKQQIVGKQEKQKECCFAISFNKDRSLMLSGFNEKIKLWNFENGNLNFQKELIGHKDKITCLQFSKYTNNFISGSNDKRIILWKYISENEWQQIETDQDNSSEIYCLLLDEKEDVLLSGGSDSSIKAWSLKQNALKYRYSLQKHKDVIYGLSMNQSESFLVSCSRDKNIILWKKERNKLWTFQQFVQQTLDDFGYRVSFVSDTEFIWIPRDCKEIVCMFELQNNEFRENQEKNFILKKQEKSSNMYYFPIVYIKKQQIFIVKHKFYIYILRRQRNGQFILATEPIECPNDELNFAGITNDGEYIVIYRQKSGSYQTLKLIYE